MFDLQVRARIAFPENRTIFRFVGDQKSDIASLMHDVIQIGILSADFGWREKFEIGGDAERNSLPY